MESSQEIMHLSFEKTQKLVERIQLVIQCLTWIKNKQMPMKVKIG